MNLMTRCFTAKHAVFAGAFALAGLCVLTAVPAKAGGWHHKSGGGHHKVRYVAVPVETVSREPATRVIILREVGNNTAPLSDQTQVTPAPQTASKAVDVSTSTPASNRIVIRIREVPAQITTVRVVESQTMELIPVRGKHHHWRKGY